MSKQNQAFFAPCPRGLEAVLRAELEQLGAQDATDVPGGVSFAGTFPLYDLMFGTFHMPAGQRPDAYGVDDPHFPSGFLRQLRYPLRSRRTAVSGSKDTEAGDTALTHQA